jgi:hypothetical protein
MLMELANNTDSPRQQPPSFIVPRSAGHTRRHTTELITWARKRQSISPYRWHRAYLNAGAAPAETDTH